jgi:anthranilate phosphoribosyltransferase
LGLSHCPTAHFAVHGVDEAKARLLKSLSGEACPERDIVAVNAGAALYVTGVADGLGSGLQIAMDVINSGAALAKVEQLAKFG